MSKRLFSLDLNLSGRLIFSDPIPDIKQFRNDKGLTQEHFALIYGMNARTVKRMEAGDNVPSFSEGFRHFLADWMEWKITKQK